MSDKEKNIWEQYADTQLRIWPENNFAVNLNGTQRKSVFMPQKIFNKTKGISMAPSLQIDVLGKFQILTMGFASHTKGYYHSRINKNFYDIMIVINGELCMKCDTKKAVLKKGEVLLLPPNHLCDSFVQRAKTNVMYLHFENNLRWRSRLGHKIQILKFDHFNELFCLINLYMKEIFREKPNLQILENIAECVSMYIEEEFSIQDDFKSDNLDIKTWVLACEKKQSCTLADASNYFGVPKISIENACRIQFGLSFKKTVCNLLLQKSLDFIREGKTNSEIAKLLGYADAYAFSKAFKNKFGVSPKMYYS
ncbi:MAG: helix-turn-helix domain-containing protein [Opitutales bacterium]|nr:helix-turn-helix domain-containing protein [Opitutales bacterium]